jgi:thiosulfate/3-mercaptopyruvate sulfurtransferase
MHSENAASPLVSAEWLARHLREPDLLVLDIRSATSGGGREAFEAGHIPGAVHSDYAADGWRIEKNGAGGLLPDAAALAALFGRIGLRPEHRVVVVPAGLSNNDFNAAARVYWTLKVSGHERVSILDGGFSGWTRDASRPVEAGATQPKAASPYPVKLNAALRAELADVERALAGRSAPLVDARSQKAFEGGEKSPQARVHGRLPGAILVDQGKAYDAGSNRLKAPEELERLFAGVPDKAISYCNTGHSAAGSWFVLSELLRRPGVRMYDGSMSEWTQDPARPVETGPAAKS